MREETSAGKDRFKTVREELVSVNLHPGDKYAGQFVYSDDQKDKTLAEQCYYF